MIVGIKPAFSETCSRYEEAVGAAVQAKRTRLLASIDASDGAVRAGATGSEGAVDCPEGCFAAGARSSSEFVPLLTVGWLKGWLVSGTPDRSTSPARTCTDNAKEASMMIIMTFFTVYSR